MSSEQLTGTKGASGLWQAICGEMPAHRVYIEPFWGRGTIARRKRPAELTVGCDLDPAAIRHGRNFGAVMFQCCGIEWLRGYFSPRPFANGARFRSTAANFGGASWHEHFVYLDPPYIGLRYYQHLLTLEQHRELVRLFLQLPCPAALSGYDSVLYHELLDKRREVRKLELQVRTRGGPRTECVWLNFRPPLRYHDAKLCGGGRRERERLAKRCRNWAEGLARMEPRERQAVFEACQLAVGRAEENGGPSS